MNHEEKLITALRNFINDVDQGRYDDTIKEDKGVLKLIGFINDEIESLEEPNDQKIWLSLDWI